VISCGAAQLAAMTHALPPSDQLRLAADMVDYAPLADAPLAALGIARTLVARATVSLGIHPWAMQLANTAASGGE
jgi:hypothetical protein